MIKFAFVNSVFTMPHHNNHIFRSVPAIIMACFLALAISSCGSSRHVASSTGNSTHRTTTTKRAVPQRYAQPKKHIDVAEATHNPVTKKLLKEADTWIGTPYLWGGNDEKGVDCSGFVLQVYLRALNINLPRTSEKQMEYCANIKKEELQPGDLIFFTVRGGSRVGHVGIYIGDGNMVHSSSSKGVVITPIDNPYFVTNYFSSGRVERYYALMNEKKPQKKTPTKETKPQAPLMASTPKKQTNASTTKTPQAAKPKSAKPNVSKTMDANQVKKTEKKAGEPVFATPLPEQVFASKDRIVTQAEEETPDFFD